MKKNALRKDILIEIIKTKNRYLSLFLITALGVAFFSGIRASAPDMRLSADAYYDESNLMDIRIASTLGLTTEDTEAIAKIEGIKQVMPSYNTDVLCDLGDEQAVLRLMSVPDTINKIDITKGRLPESASECLVDSNFLDTTDYELGDTITVESGENEDLQDTLKETGFTIVGAGNSSYYLSLSRGTSTIGSGSIHSFVIIPKDSFSLEVYTEIYATIEGVSEISSYTDEYEDTVATVVKRVEAIADERAQIRYDSVLADAEKEIADAKQEIADAEQKLADAAAELEQGRQEIADGKQELADHEQEIADGWIQIAEQETVIENGQAEIDAGWQSIYAGEAQLADGKAQLSAAEEEVRTGRAALDEQSLLAAESEIASQRAQLSQAENTLNESKAKLSSSQAELDSGIAKLEESRQELLDGEAELQTARETLANAAEELTLGETEYEEAKADSEPKIADAKQKIADAETELADLEVPAWYVLSRQSIQTYVEYGQNADRIHAIGTVFPLLFFIVAALVCLTTMTRMVEEERTQIGVLKALGYRKLDISAKYIVYALSASLLGSLTGLVIGQKILPLFIIDAYKILYPTLPDILTPLNFTYSVTSTAAAVLCTTLATFLACYKELASVPAKLMRPAAPKSGKRIFLERIGFLWKRLNFSVKSTARNLFRYKKRFFMTLFGIGGCMALIVVGFGLNDSISSIGNLQYSRIHIYDSSISLENEIEEKERQKIFQTVTSDPDVMDAMLIKQSSIDVESGGTERSAYVIIPENPEEIHSYISLQDRVTGASYELSDRGVIITEKLASLLKVKTGDSIYLKDEDTEQTKVTITAITENYFYHYVYMTPGLYEQLYGSAPEYNGILTINAGQDAAFEAAFKNTYMAETSVSGIVFTTDSAATASDMLESMDAIIYILIISAGLLAFVVLYNLNNINVSERKRELATLKVLGFYDLEISQYVVRENVCLTVIGIIAGAFLGVFLHQYVIQTTEVDLTMFGRIISWKSYLYSTLLTASFSGIVNLVMHFKLKKIDMVESMKSVE